MLGSKTQMWWVDGQGIALASQWGVLWAGTKTTNTVDWVLQAQQPQMTVSGHSLDSPTVTLRSSEPFNWSDGDAKGFYTNLAFLTPGCWQIRVQAGSETLQATIYVYPAACRRDPGTPVPSGCKPPAG